MIKTENFRILKISSNPFRCWGGVKGAEFNKCGTVQLNFLKREGLLPSHKMLDIGCGLFRGGIQFASYLNEKNYFAIDSNIETVQKGYEVIRNKSLQKKLPKSNIAITDEFDSSIFGVRFDYIFSQSVWTHIDFEACRLCLINSFKQLKEGNSLYTSVFMANESAKGIQIKNTKYGPTETYPDKDPFYYTESQIKKMASFINADVRFIEWNFCEMTKHKVTNSPEIKDKIHYRPYFIKFTKI
jgi:hypothetical protein